MDLYVILRRNGWKTGQDLEEGAARSTEEGDKADSGVRWIRSYVLAEDGGEVGTVCIYEAESPEAIRSHAAAADLPVDEIVRVADTVVVRPARAPAPAGDRRVSAPAARRCRAAARGCDVTSRRPTAAA